MKQKETAQSIGILDGYPLTRMSPHQSNKTGQTHNEDQEPLFGVDCADNKLVGRMAITGANRASNNKSENDSKTPGGKGFTRGQWFTLVVIGSVHFSSAICISLQAPFFPQEAESKGATATEYGLVFGSFEFIAFLSSPILGRYLDTLGVKRTLNSGMFIASISSVLFGMIDNIMEHDKFIFFAFLLRMTEALGSTAALVAAFSITAAVFPNSIATTFATLEVFYGIGYIVGPTLGGFLYSLGGYKLPFLVMGSTQALVAVFVFFVLPPISRDPSLDKSTATLGQLVRVPGVVLDAVSVSATSISMGYYAATLEPHLRQFKLHPFAMGLMFIISGGTYACTAPIIGRICDKWVYPKRVISIGSLFIITSYVIVGPAPFLPLPTTLTLCIIGLVIHGFGLACLMVPTFIDSICSAVAAGFKDDIALYGLLSGLWSSSFALGAFIGPSVSGFLYDLVGFRKGTLFVITVHTILFVVCTCFIGLEKRRSVSPKRVRLLSERMDPTDDSSDDSLNTNTNLNLAWNEQDGKRNGKSNGYGSISRHIEVPA